MIKDYYEILGITQIASYSDICKAYKSLSLKWHPERTKDDKAVFYKIFSDVSEAFSVLSDNERRALYDRLGYLNFKNGCQNKDGHFVPGYQFLGNCEEIFESFFGSDNFFSALVQCDSDYAKYLSEKQNLRRLNPKPIELTLDLTIVDIFKGKILNVGFQREIINPDGITTAVKKFKK